MAGRSEDKSSCCRCSSRHDRFDLDLAEDTGPPEPRSVHDRQHVEVPGGINLFGTKQAPLVLFVPQQMGLGSPSEKTAQHCTAKFWLIVRGEQVFQLDGRTQLALSDDFKNTIKDFPKPATELPKYPSEPTVWRNMQPELFAQMYEVEPPLPSRLDHTAVARLLQVWPCRRPNKRVAKGPAHGNPASSSGDTMMSIMPNISQMIQQGIQIAM